MERLNKKLRKEMGDDVDIQKLIEKWELQASNQDDVEYYSEGELLIDAFIKDLKSLTVEGEKKQDTTLADIMQNMIDNGVMLNQQQSRSIRQAYQDSLKDKPDINLEL